VGKPGLESPLHAPEFCLLTRTHSLPHRLGAYKSQDIILKGSKRTKAHIRLSSEKPCQTPATREKKPDSSSWKPFSPLLQNKLSDPSKFNLLLYISGEEFWGENW
jgi:hypothetical protein